MGVMKASLLEVAKSTWRDEKCVACDVEAYYRRAGYSVAILSFVVPV